MINQTPFKIFIVEDNVWYCELLAYHLSLNPDYEVHKFENAEQCLKNLHLKPSVICLDYSLPDKSGMEVLHKIKAYNQAIEVIIISGQDNISTAVQLLHEGAYDYIEKNDETKNRLWQTILHIREHQALKKENESLKAEVVKKYDFDNIIIGQSEAIKKTFKVIEKASQSKIAVSITGETGTGKELVAKAIHYNSPRKSQPFIPVNITAIPDDLIESELFGHEKGAFTGAQSRRKGLFEEAHNGTIFLDEIGEMKLSLQTKLLRTLQEMEIKRIGNNKPISIDARIIVATNRNLAEEVKKGNFREDLYYRLLGLPIHLPPLRERDNDVLLIADHFIENYKKENNIGSLKLSEKAKNKLRSYHYPGNIRELKAIIDLGCVLAEDELIQEDHINFENLTGNLDLLDRELTMEEYNHYIIKKYLQKYNDNVLKVAEKLNIGKSTIYRYIKENKIN